MTATFFVTTDWIGTPGFMSWDQLRQLSDWGMSVQSHTVSHPFLSELERDRLREELTLSKLVLDRELGQETTQIALPGGNGPKRSLRSLLGEAGYRVVAGSRWGRNADGAEAYDATKLVRRCTVPQSPTPDLARRVVTGDPRLALVRHPREVALFGLRGLLGPTRYSELRRRFLDLFAA
jgi:peptidoglycan/xylan/chitin deacetylase (PgdA/CDA1 family)